MKPESLLALGGYVRRERVDALLISLSTIWHISMQSAIGQLNDDLALSQRWFDPVAQGQRLRRELRAIPPVPTSIQDPGPPFTFRVSPTQSLVTPEGRCALDLLLQLPASEQGYVISDSQLLYYDRLLAHLYRDWSRHRLNSVIDLLAGEEKPLQISAAGVVLALLVNRSTHRNRALKRFAAGEARDVVDEAFFAAVKMFTETLAPKIRQTRAPRLISGWMLYEARRRLGDDVLIVEGAHPDTEGRLWIDESKQDQVLDVVARDLGRGNRSRFTTESLANAFDSLVAAFRAEITRLAGFGLAHERPANTHRVREALLKKFSQQIEGP